MHILRQLHSRAVPVLLGNYTSHQRWGPFSPQAVQRTGWKPELAAHLRCPSSEYGGWLRVPTAWGWARCFPTGAEKLWCSCSPIHPAALPTLERELCSSKRTELIPVLSYKSHVRIWDDFSTAHMPGSAQVEGKDSTLPFRTMVIWLEAPLGSWTRGSGFHAQKQDRTSHHVVAAPYNIKWSMVSKKSKWSKHWVSSHGNQPCQSHIISIFNRCQVKPLNTENTAQYQKEVLKFN